eukprot:TRINITY_DN32048_c0_g1_i1.p1 TRINITY_DN32048_c0_g1~~TRINITY_DN32048_c0_g1_i1.p1  ORF type:complete len:1482 (+),score=263.91 TRINITY_DN32048_c0_g1_i1:93-4538(+)
MATKHLQPEKRKELERELDELQQKYSPRADGRSATRAYGDLVVQNLDINKSSKPSRGERVLEDIDNATALLHAKERQQTLTRDEYAQRKDGLDLAMIQLCGHAMKLRSDFAELDLKLGRPARDAQAEKVSLMAIPYDVMQQFEDQQQTLVEQRRQLMLLKQEKQDAQAEQLRMFRDARREYFEAFSKGDVLNDEAGNGPVDPVTLREAHKLLRLERGEELVNGDKRLPVGTFAGEVVPRQDNHLFVEIFSVDGLNLHELDGLQRLTVRAFDTATGLELTSATLPSPLRFEGLKPRVLQLTVPSSAGDGENKPLDVEFTLVGRQSSASMRVPFGVIGVDNRPLRPLKLARLVGQWAEAEPNISLRVGMSGVSPVDSRGRVLASTRVVQQSTNAVRSRYRGGEMPTSQAFLEERFEEWQSQGAPDPLREAQWPLDANRDYTTDLRSEGFLSSPGLDETILPSTKPLDTCGQQHGDDRPLDDDATELTEEDVEEDKRPADGECFAGFGVPGSRNRDELWKIATGNPKPSRRTPTSRPSPAPVADRSLGHPRENLGARGRSVTPPKVATEAGYPHASGFSKAAYRGQVEEGVNLPPQSESSLSLRDASCAHLTARGLAPPPPLLHTRDTACYKQRATPSAPVVEEGFKPRAADKSHSEAWNWTSGFPFAAFAGFVGGYGREEDTTPTRHADSLRPRGDSASVRRAKLQAFADEFNPGPPRTPRGSRNRGDIAADELPFAAFAGEADTSQVDASSSRRPRTLAGTATPKMSTAVSLQLRPPRNDKTVGELFSLLRLCHAEGKFDKSNAQLVLDFAARVAQPEALKVETDGHTDDDLAEFAGILLVALGTFKQSNTLTLWILEALTAIWRCASPCYRQQFSVPLFESFQSAALRFSKATDVQVHMRLLAGLAAVATPECVMETKALINYVLDLLDPAKTRMPPIAAEHALAVLCVVGSTHRVSEQVGHTTVLLRGFQSDPHLVTRALITLAVLFELVEQDRLASIRGTGLSEKDKARHLTSLGISSDTTEVRLISAALDLHPNDRKVAGAALRALSVQSRVSHERLTEVVTDTSRSLALAQQRHASSLSVNLHVAEIVLTVVREKPSLIVDALVLLVARTLQAFWRETSVAVTALEALRLIATIVKHRKQVLGLLPAPQLVLIGDEHHADARITTPHCQLVVLLAEASGAYREELAKVGAVAVAVRSLENNPNNVENIRVSTEALRSVVYASKIAVRHAVRLGAIRSLFDAVVANNKEVPLVREVLSAIALLGQDKDARRQLVDPEIHDTSMAVVILWQIATSTTLDDPDILAQASCAVGSLTFTEDELDSDKRQMIEMRRLIDRTKLAELCEELANKYPQFTHGPRYFEGLINAAPMCDLAGKRILSQNGASEGLIKCRDFEVEIGSRGRSPRTVQRGASRKQPLPSPSQAPAAVGGFDVFAPLRALGLGKDEIEVQDSDDDELVRPQEVAKGGDSVAAKLAGLFS